MPLDIGVGILLAIFTTQVTPLSLDMWAIICGIVFALLPDLDFLIHLSRQKADEFSHDHRNLFHNPLLFVPTGFAILAFIDINLAYLFVLCSIAHFLHDSVGMGWGIRWAYPFSKRYYKFFSDKQGKTAFHLMSSWTPEEQKQAASGFGNPDWLSDYFKFSREFIIELIFLAVAITFLVSAFDMI